MKTELCLNRAVNLTEFSAEDDRIEFFHHLPGAEFAKVAPLPS